MISIDWKKGETHLSGNIDTILTEVALVMPPIVGLLRSAEWPNPEVALLKQIAAGLSMDKDEIKDYIISEKYERGANNA